MANEAKTVNTLRDILPALFVGQGGQALTADQIKSREQVARSLLQQATDTSPTGGGWFSVASKGLAGLRSGMEQNAADAAAAQNATDSQNAVAAIYGGNTPTATVAPSGAVAPVSSSPTVAYNQGEVQAQVVDELRNQGIPENVIQGALANMQDESNFNPGVNEANPTVAGSRGGFGLYQLTGPRRVAYEKWAGDQGLRLDDPRAQARYFALELQGPEAAAAQKILSTTTPNEAAQAINTYFLRPAPEHRDRRNARYANMTFPEMASSQQSVSPVASQAASGYVDPSASVQPRQAIAQALSSSAPAPQQQNIVAQSLSSPQPPAPAAPSASIPGILSNSQRQAAQAAVGNPRLDQSTRQIAQSALERDYQAQYQQQQAQAAYQQQQAEWQYKLQQGQYQQQQAQQELQGRVDYLVRGGMSPQDATAVAGNDELFKQYGQNAFKKEERPSVVREVEAINAERQAAGQAPITIQDYQRERAQAGATRVNVDTGTVPQGYQNVRDSEGRIIRQEPIPGGPADTSRSEAQQAATRSTASDVIVSAADRARQALASPGLPSTGTVGNLLSALPESNAAELQRQVGVLKSNATIEALNEMRRNSPTGGALGSVTEGEGKMLAAKAGTLDPSSPNFARDLDDYERTMLRTIHGKEAGDRIYDQTRKDASNKTSSGEKKRMKFNPETGRLE